MRQEQRNEVLVDYGLDEIDTVTIKIPQHLYEGAVAELARELVNEGGIQDVTGWGRGQVELHETHDGVGVHSWRWVEVTFRRRRKKK